MAFKSYSWSIGTTSFRTSQLNYKIERQLQLLNEFWSLNNDSKWNNTTQEKYYRYLQQNEFVQGDAPRPDKDAREKTSGLVDLGLITAERRLTEVGFKIKEIVGDGIKKDNIFMIPDDSYNYLLQFLKMQITDDDIKIKPFLALIYMIEKLDYLSFEEFTYLLPLCKNKYDVKEMVKLIETNRLGLDIDEIIRLKIFDMKNYLEAWTLFEKSYPVTESTFEQIGINRKSKAYDRPYNNVYHILVDLVFHQKNYSFDERKLKYNELSEACKKISGNTRSLWTNYLFGQYKINNINEKYDIWFKNLDISAQFNIKDFKRVFFEKLHIFKWKVNLKEYFDLNKRYFSLTDILKFGEEKIELDLLPKYYFADIIDSLLEESVLENQNYIKEYNTLVPIENISKEYKINIYDVVSNINESLGTKLEVSNINNYIESEKIKEFNKLIDEKFNTKDLIRLLDQIKNREDDIINNYVTDNATVPTIFEYVLGIAWYRISNKNGNILKYMNLSLDADLLPKTHAGGGMADIVYEYEESDYPKHNLLLEATLSESTGQRAMEMEPVSRHLGESIKQSGNEKDYVIFVAPNLEERIILDFRNMKSRCYPLGNDEYTNGLKIIPIDTEMVKQLLIKNINYSNIYNWFETAYNSKIVDPKWYNTEILQKV